MDGAHITAIVQKSRGNSVTIWVDGEPWLTVRRAVVLELGLRSGDPADAALREQVLAAEARQQAYDSALNLISYRQRAEGELRQRLQRKGLAPDAVEHALARLRDIGLIDDAEFARSWVSSRGEGAGSHGKSRLAAELRAKGVTAEFVNEAVSGLDEVAQATDVARRRAARLHDVEYDEFRRRLGGFLQRRGFGYEAVSAAIKAAWSGRETEAQ